MDGTQEYGARTSSPSGTQPLRSTATGRGLSLSDARALREEFEGRYLNVSGGRMRGDLDMGGFELKNGGVASQQSAVCRSWVMNNFLRKTDVFGGLTMGGSIDMDGNAIRGLPYPKDGTEAVNAKYVLDNFVRTGETLKGSADGNISMGRFLVSQAEEPTSPNHLANKGYVDGSISRAILGGIDSRILSVSDPLYLKKADHLSGDAGGDIVMGRYRVLQGAQPLVGEHLVNARYVGDNFARITDVPNRVREVGDAVYVRRRDHLKGTSEGDIHMGDGHVIRTSSDPVSNLDVVNKRYADAEFVHRGELASKVLEVSDGVYARAGESLRGVAGGNVNMASYVITQSAPPTSGDHVATKGYVDGALGVAIGDSMSERIVKTCDGTYSGRGSALKGAAAGSIDMGAYKITQGKPTSLGHLTNRRYVDDNYVSNASLAARVSRVVDAVYVRKADHVGGAASSDVNMGAHSIEHPRPPLSPKHLANKEYVDGLVPGGSYEHQWRNWTYLGLSEEKRFPVGAGAGVPAAAISCDLGTGSYLRVHSCTLSPTVQGVSPVGVRMVLTLNFVRRDRSEGSVDVANIDITSENGRLGTWSGITSYTVPVKKDVKLLDVIQPHGDVEALMVSVGTRDEHGSGLFNCGLSVCIAERRTA